MSTPVENAENNVVSLLRAAALRVGDRTALAFELDGSRPVRVSFAELWDRVDRTSVGLRRAGLSAGDRAILMIPMSIDLYVALLAVVKLGAACVFVDPWIGRRQIADMAAFAEPRAFIGVAKAHLLRLADARLRTIPLSVTTGRRLLGMPARHTLSELQGAVGDGAIHPVAADDPALVTFTSGSSRLPKGSNRTHGFLVAQHAALWKEFPYRDDDVDMPMFPVFALNNLAGGTTSIVPRMDFRRVAEVDGRAIAEQMRRHGVTTCTASPPFFDRLAEHVRADPHHRPILRRILTGGAPVNDDQLRQWQRALPDAEIVVVYGSTEAEPVAHIDARERLSAQSSLYPLTPGYCVGRPTPAVRTKLIRITAEPVTLDDAAGDNAAGDGRTDAGDGWARWQAPPRQIGELIVAGAHVGTSYFNNPQAVAENKIRDAAGTVWHRMGDTGYFDAEGRFWLVGRVHSTILRGGETVHPQLVEQAARGDDRRIRQAAAVGLDDPKLGQRVAVVLAIGQDDATSDEGTYTAGDAENAGTAAIVECVRQRLAAAGLPCDEVIVSPVALPVDPRHNSKIDYRILRERIAGGLRDD